MGRTVSSSSSEGLGISGFDSVVFRFVESSRLPEGSEVSSGSSGGGLKSELLLVGVEAVGSVELVESVELG